MSGPKCSNYRLSEEERRRQEEERKRRLEEEMVKKLKESIAKEEKRLNKISMELNDIYEEVKSAQGVLGDGFKLRSLIEALEIVRFRINSLQALRVAERSL